MVAFAASCIGLLLFLWISFGGSIPFAPQGYRLKAEFNQAVQLAQESDVRISGVSVGKVISVSLDRRTGLTHAVMEIDSQLRPAARRHARDPASRSRCWERPTSSSRPAPRRPKLPDGATLPPAQIAPTVPLDQILSTFDPTTRRAFSTWMQQDGIALTNRGQDFNAAFAELYPFATNVESVLSVLRRDDAATSTLLRDGGQVFGRWRARPAQLQGFVRNSNARVRLHRRAGHGAGRRRPARSRRSPSPRG